MSAGTAALERALAARPREPALWRALGDARAATGDPVGADAAYLAGVRCGVEDALLRGAAGALAGGRLGEAEAPLRARLREHPTDVAAMRMLAELAARLGRLADADALLARALELCPSFAAARHNLAMVRYRQNDGAGALALLEPLLAAEPDNPALLNLQAAALGQTGDPARAIAVWEALLARGGGPKLWLSYGHALKTIGRAADAVAAYARAAAEAPGLGEAWFALANMKTHRFAADEVRTMQRALAAAGEEDALHLRFALGKAAEDAGDPAGAFAHYTAGNALGAARAGYVPDETHALATRSAALFTPAFFAGAGGCEDDAPIFVVGLPRAGSTLVEQILASHSAVEGTAELPELVAIARRLAGPERAAEHPYPALLAALTRGERRALGQEYVDRTRVYRKTGRPRFIDKTPQNWAHVGLIQAILPRATVIDVRRHPMANGMSAFRQHFARGHGFTYDLVWLGRYWRDYATTMAAIDRALPARVHRVIYERLVTDPEREVRALLAHCGLAFEAACLEPHRTERAVRTPSAEQVRRPITTAGVDEWQQYAAMLQPLADALGDALDGYPDWPDARLR